MMKAGLMWFFVMEPRIFKFIKNDKTYLEKKYHLKYCQKKIS